MLHTEIIPETTIVSATVSGGINADDITTCREQIVSMSSEGTKPSLLLTFEDLDASEVTPQAAWEDLKSSKLLDDVAKVAIVTDKGWMDKLSGAVDALSSASLEVFEPDRRDEAIAWLSK